MHNQAMRSEYLARRCTVINHFWCNYTAEVRALIHSARLISIEKKKAKKKAFFFLTPSDTLVDRWRGADHTVGGNTLI